MSDLFEPFVRKQFDVEAVRVDPTNIEAVAEACGGRIMGDGEKEGEFSRKYIKVKVFFPLNDEQTKARVGDWVVKHGKSFKVYKDKNFRKTFEEDVNKKPKAAETKESDKKSLPVEIIHGDNPLSGEVSKEA